MTVQVKLPRYVQAKQLKGRTAFYWTPPTKYRRIAQVEDVLFPFDSVLLGTDLGARQLAEVARPYNEQFDEWRTTRRSPKVERALGQYGTVRWVTETYLRSEQFRDKVGEISRPDYRNVFEKVCQLTTDKGRTVGQLPVQSITPRAADKIYARMIEGEKFRRGEKAVVYCKTAWAVIGRLYPDVMARDPQTRAVLNPWVGVTKKKRAKRTKAAVDRASVYRFAAAAIKAGRPEAAAAAVICFEWLQRPMSVVQGHFRWSDYDPMEYNGWVRIEHHKTGEIGWHPLVLENPETGEFVRCYPEAEAVLAQVPKLGVSVVLGPQGQQYKPTRFAQIVRKIATDAGLEGFSLDACRHGGMTELEEAGLSSNEGRSLSMHRSTRAYEGYAKQTQLRVMAPTLKRLAWRAQNTR